MPKFEPRSTQGLVVGYYLQQGGEWKGIFDDYDFNTPRRLTELHPACTMEVKLVGPISFPMKEKYNNEADTSAHHHQASLSLRRRP